MLKLVALADFISDRSYKSDSKVLLPLICARYIVRNSGGPAFTRRSLKLGCSDPDLASFILYLNAARCTVLNLSGENHTLGPFRWAKRSFWVANSTSSSIWFLGFQTLRTLSDISLIRFYSAVMFSREALTYCLVTSSLALVIS